MLDPCSERLKDGRPGLFQAVPQTYVKGFAIGSASLLSYLTVLFLAEGL